MYEVYKSPLFDKRAKEILSTIEKTQIKRLFLRLKSNPYIGKPLRYNFLREIKFESKRIYFLIYKEICLVLIVSASDKKSQQKTINEIIKYLPEYKKLAYQLSND